MNSVETVRYSLDSRSGHPVGDYDGRTVEFLCEVNGNLLLLIGQFTEGVAMGARVLAIRYQGRLHFDDHCSSEYVFFPTQAHLRSTVPATRAGAKVDYLMEKPFVSRDWVKMDLKNELSLRPTPEYESACQTNASERRKQRDQNSWGVAELK